MDIRELIEDREEILRVSIAGLLKQVWTAMPVHITQDTVDGHVAVLQPTIKREVTDPLTGIVSYEDHPEHVDVPIHHLGGGGVSKTFPCKKNDTGLAIYASRPFDTWFQSDGTQQPIDDRSHHLGDAMYLSGARSVPRMLQQVSKDSAQTRSDDKLHVSDMHPQNGAHVKSCDPSTSPASQSFDPFTQATSFYEHLVHPTSGIAGNATQGGTTHSHGVTKSGGAFMSALNMLHQVLAHPSLGSLLSASNGQHMVQAHPSAGVKVSSTANVAISAAQAISLSAPSLSLPSGSVGSGSLGSGAASTNVGALGGDLSGTLPNPNVVGLLHITNANLLPNAANDAAAAGAGVAVGSLYRNGSVLMVRVA